MGAKGKSPWITLNGEDTADSQLIIEYLGPKFRKDLTSHLTAEEKAVAHSLQIMIDEYFLWYALSVFFLSCNFFLCVYVCVYVRIYVCVCMCAYLFVLQTNES